MGAKRKWIAPLAVGATFSLVLLLFLTTLSSPDDPFALLPLSLLPSALLSHPSNPFAALYAPVYVEPKLRPAPPSSHLRPSPPPPRLAYLISGTVGDGNMLKRVLLALYHPANLYVVHLDLEASSEERDDLRNYVAGHPLFASVENVRMITKANLVTYRGPTMVANTLHAAAILLREGGNWDWFINLSASDYPLRAKPIIIDPGLYLLKKADVFWIPQRRSVPTAFKLFTGSAWMALSYSFIDYCIWGWENLPRTVLMYYANFISSPEGYFHTVICNAKEFRNTTVNHDLHFVSWDNPPKQHPHYLSINDMSHIVDSNAPFARKFRRDHPILDKIDAELLFRRPNMIVPGGWCVGSRKNGSDPCLVVGNTTILRPGPGAIRLERLMLSLLSEENFRPRQCK
ncbi:hypothetical protein GW17_00017867 [Ensete ventricosum]|nr:hypothetical protein GW17_00017867 [Ensete ventricosum]